MTKRELKALIDGLSERVDELARQVASMRRDRVRVNPVDQISGEPLSDEALAAGRHLAAARRA